MKTASISKVESSDTKKLLQALQEKLKHVYDEENKLRAAYEKSMKPLETREKSIKEDIARLKKDCVHDWSKWRRAEGCHQEEETRYGTNFWEVLIRVCNNCDSFEDKRGELIKKICDSS